MFRVHRAFVARLLALVLWGAAATSPAGAVIETVGSQELQFEWAPASGSPTGYVVGISRDGEPLRVLEVVTVPRATVPVDGAGAVAVAVRAFRLAPGGGVTLGPLSEISETVRIDEPPAFVGSALWTLHCGSCGSLAVRRVSGAVLGTFSAPSSEWTFLRYAKLRPGAPLAVWHAPALPAIVITHPFESPPRVEAFLTGSDVASHRFAGTADLLGNGTEDLVLHDVARGAVELWRLTAPSRLEAVATLDVPVDRRLVSTQDVTADGRDDLLWHDPATGRVEASVIGTGVLEIGVLAGDARLAAVSDLDGDRLPDLLWQSADGSLRVWSLERGGLRDVRAIPSAAGDARLRVVGTADLDGIPGAEIAVQHRDTGELSVIFPLRPEVSERERVLTPGSRWRAVDLRP